jgi:hypothetical protein
MGLSIPVAVNYQSPLVSFPLKAYRGFANTKECSAPEGPRTIPVEIDWINMGGSLNCVHFNVQDGVSGSANSFSQIAGLKIDNSLCGADVVFYFPDTSETLTIPAYSPDVIVPAFTNALEFWVQAVGDEPIDVTRFQILNFIPPPIAVPTSQEQNVSAAANIAITGAGSTQIIPATVSGTIEAVSLLGTIVTAGAAGEDSFQLIDGTTKVLGWGAIAASNAQSLTQLLLNLSNTSIRFSGGVSIAQFGAWTPSASSFLTYNILYRKP